MRLIEGEKYFKTKINARKYAKRLRSKGFGTLVYKYWNKYCVAYSNWKKISGIA